ncbi:MAG: hypothetical protein WHT82_12645 [Limisphaera sp.]
MQAWICALCAWLVCAGPHAIGVETAHGAPAEPGQMFREYLTQLPWIKHVTYRRSHSRKSVAVAPQPGSGASERILPRLFVLERFEAAWQPEGWYKRYLETEKGRVVPMTRGRRTTYTFEPVSAGLETVVGRNRYFYWSLTDSQNVLEVTFRTNTTGGRGRHHEMRAIRDAEMLCDLRLGLDPLGGGTLRWLNDVEFEVGPEEGGFRRPGGRGRITRVDHRGHPTELVFEAFGWPGPTNFFRVSYAYLPERDFPPWLYVVEELDAREGWLRHTNYVDDIEFGVDESAPEGYFPEMFRGRVEPVARVYLVSNDVRYVRDARGQWVRRPADDDELLARLPGLDSWQDFRRAVLLGVLGAGLLVLIWGSRKSWWRRPSQS